MRGQNSQEIAPAPVRYSARQIALHWIVFVLVAFQFVMGDNMTDLFRAAHGGRPTDTSAIWAPIHIAIGILILIAMLARLALRRRDGVPKPPKQAAVLQWLAAAVHAGLYVDLIGAPIVGAIAYFLLPSFAGTAPSHDPPNPCHPGRAPFRWGALALACRSR